MPQIDLVEWFDVNNMEHLRAYRELARTGFWPVDFIPENVVLSGAWIVGLTSLLASAYVDSKLS